jgi:hypothetical protein
MTYTRFRTAGFQAQKRILVIRTHKYAEKSASVRPIATCKVARFIDRYLPSNFVHDNFNHAVLRSFQWWWEWGRVYTKHRKRMYLPTKVICELNILYTL